MAYRSFIDETGTTWQVWEVRPSRVERRMRERRIAQLPFTGPDRRSNGPDRRRRAEQRIFLGEDLAQGWLAFHSGSAKRRYAPIPDGWSEMPKEELSRLCREAKPVQAGGPSFWPRAGGPPESHPESRDTSGGEEQRGAMSPRHRRSNSA